MGDEAQWTSRAIAVPVPIDVVTLLSPQDAFLRILEDRLAVDIHVRDSQVAVTGKPGDVASAIGALTKPVTIIRTGQDLSEETMEQITNLAVGDLEPSEIPTADITSTRGRAVRPKTLNQKRHADAVDRHTVVFRIDPAGIGKTYLTMAKVVQALQSKRVGRIILIRPMIKTGGRLDFLPNTLNDKIDPYLWPLYGALRNMAGTDSVPKLLTPGTIEITPLAYMYSRALSGVFITLDEAQSMSSEQMKMFLTRLGFGSGMVVTGDITQIDPLDGMRNRLRQVTQVLGGVEDTVFCTLIARNVVCHKLVSRIVVTYDSYDSIQQGEGGR